MSCGTVYNDASLLCSFGPKVHSGLQLGILAGVGVEPETAAGVILEEPVPTFE